MSLFPNPWLRVSAWAWSRSPAKSKVRLFSPSRTRLPFRPISLWADRLQTQHALCVEWTQWITLWTECFHCKDAAFPRHFRTACSGYTVFLRPVHTSAKIKCALGSNLIYSEASWQCQSEVINNITGDCFWCFRIPMGVNCSHFVFTIGFFLFAPEAWLWRCDVIFLCKFL